MQQVDAEYEANKRVAESLKGYMGKRLNVMNAFETPILEGLMAAVKVESLHSIGTVLDASAKCYAFRVDNTYDACYRVLSATGGERGVELKDNGSYGEANDRNGDEADDLNNDGGDFGTEATSDEDGADARGKGDQDKILKSSNLSEKAKQITRDTRRLAEGLWKRFATSKLFGNDENDLCDLFEQLAKDISAPVMKRRVGAVQGSLDRKDNQFSIEDPIYRKISKNFEEGSARSLVSNEVLMNDHGNFLILHTNWPGDEPSRQFPSLVKHLSATSADEQRHTIDQTNCAVERAQSKRPSEYAILTQICADDEHNVPIVDFQTRENFGQLMEGDDDDAFGGDNDRHEIENQADDVLSLHQMDVVDEGNANPPAAIDLVIGSTANELDETSEHEMREEREEMPTTNVPKREGEAFGMEVAEREKQLAGQTEDIDEEQIGRLIDENLLPPTQTDDFVPLKNTLIEDASHWMGDQNLQNDLAADQMRVKKGKTKRQNNETGTTKALTKRRQQKANDFEDINGGIADDMCWIPKRIVSTFVKSAIADIQKTSMAKKRLELDGDFDDGTQLLPPNVNRRLMRDKAKQIESMAYDPVNLFRARIFFKGHVGLWSFFPIDGAVKNVHLIHRLHMLPPFSLPPPVNEQYDEFNKLYFELTMGQNAADAAGDSLSVDEDGGGREWDGTLGDEVPADIEFMGSPHSTALEGSRGQKDRLDNEEEDESDYGFGFLNNITLRDIKQIYYQTNFNVSNVKKAMLKVISSKFEKGSSDADMLMEEEEPDDDEFDMSSCSSVAESLGVVQIGNGDGRKTPAAVEDNGEAVEDNGEAVQSEVVQQNTKVDANGINSRELFAQVPNFLKGITKRNLTVTNSFAVLLHLCNDKQFTLAQKMGTNKLVEGHFMSEFFVNFSK